MSHPLEKGYRVVLQNGDVGVVHEVLSDGYEFLMDSTGKYHHTDLNGYSGIGNAYDLNWDRTSDLNCGQECWNCKTAARAVFASCKKSEVQ